MSQEELHNISLSGKEVDKLRPHQKIGSIGFIAGLTGLIFTLVYSIKTGKSIHAISPVFLLTSFSIMLLGSLLFTHYHGKKYGLDFKLLSRHRTIQHLWTISALGGLTIFAMAWLGYTYTNPGLFLVLSFCLSAGGVVLYTIGSYAGIPAGIKNNYVWTNSLTNSGLIGWILGIALTTFYIQLYWFSDSLSGLIDLFDPLSYLFRNKAADNWFVYGSAYTFLILFLGIKFMVKYRHNRYQLIRTVSVILAQLILAYFIPNILESMNEGAAYFGKDLKQVWPLNYYVYTESWSLKAMAEPQVAGPSGTFYFIWGLVLFMIVTPFLTYLVGKRWYCSWVCGCGGLAETAGDSFRHLSSKKIRSWKIERWMIHSVMVFVLIMTVAALWPYFSGKDYEIGFLTISKTSYFIYVIGMILLSSAGLILLSRKYDRKVLLVGAVILLVTGALLTIAYLTGNKSVFYLKSTTIKKAYGFLIGSAFSGVIGVGFYPILGNRVWCRFGCPMAGYMGIFQRFKSRFRITTNGAQCISCGNCSTYCEQGIDVRSYAQKGENIIRSSCVGCGICSAVCPRGVLKLENGPEEGRFEPNPLEVSKDGIKLNM